VRNRAEAQRRLNELLAILRNSKSELALAELNGFEFVAHSARREILKRNDMLRRHCAATGLPLPTEVPQIPE